MWFHFESLSASGGVSPAFGDHPADGAGVRRVERPRSMTVRNAFSIWKKEKRTNTVASFSDETAAGFHDGRFGVCQAHLPGEASLEL